MKKFILIILLVLSQKLIADECFEQAKSFGGINRIDESCLWSRHQENTHQHHLHVKVQDFKVWGHANIIWIQHPKWGLRPIAGENSRLNHIIAMSGSQNEPEVAILQINEHQQKEILVFNLHFAGHVKPRRLIESPKLKSASSLSIDSAREKILVLHNSGYVDEFQLTADDRSVHSTKRAQWRKLPLKGKHKIIDLVATTDAIMALTDDGRLCTYTIAHQYLQDCLELKGVQFPLKQMRYFHQNRLLEISNPNEWLQFLLE